MYFQPSLKKGVHDVRQGRLVYNGDDIAAAFHGKRLTGNRGWIYCCPAHRDTRPSGWMSPNGVPFCHAGCAASDIDAALREHGFMPTVVAQPVKASDVHQAREATIKKAQRIWNDATGDILTTPHRIEDVLPSDYDVSVVAYYLKSRGITLPPPLVMRRWDGNGTICCIQRRDGWITAVHIRDARGRRFTHGWMGSGAVQFAPPSNGELGLAEGPEDALSVMQLYGIPCWAACGAKRLHQIAIPGGVHLLHLFADADAAGQQALALATKTYTSRGYNVRTHTPVGYKDFNDVLKAQVRS